MQWQQGGDLLREGQVLEVAEHWFESKEAAKEFCKTEIYASIGGSDFVYCPSTDRFLVLALNSVKDAVAASA